MKVNTAISFDMMEAPLRNAFRQYLVPLLGDAMVGEVVEIYEFGPNPDVFVIISYMLNSRNGSATGHPNPAPAKILGNINCADLIGIAVVINRIDIAVFAHRVLLPPVRPAIQHNRVYRP